MYLQGMKYINILSRNLAIILQGLLTLKIDQALCISSKKYVLIKLLYDNKRLAWSLSKTVTYELKILKNKLISWNANIFYILCLY